MSFVRLGILRPEPKPDGPYSFKNPSISSSCPQHGYLPLHTTLFMTGKTDIFIKPFNRSCPSVEVASKLFAEALMGKLFATVRGASMRVGPSTCYPLVEGLKSQITPHNHLCCQGSKKPQPRAPVATNASFSQSLPVQAC